MARIITKELAEKIAKKLGAVMITKKGRAHDLACVYHQGRLIAHFGIRHGSQKDLGHDHVSRDLHIRPAQARLLAQCPLKKEDFIQLLLAQGLIERANG